MMLRSVSLSVKAGSKRLFSSSTSNMAPRITRPKLREFPFVLTQSTRWSDNDQYGHLNNAVYYHFYDALVNGYYWDECKHNVMGDLRALVVASGSEYFEIIDGFPKPLVLGLAVRKLGRSSVEFEIGVFQQSKTAEQDESAESIVYEAWANSGEDPVPATTEEALFRELRNQKAKALGRFVHVFVDASTNKAVPIPADLRKGLEAIYVGPSLPKM
ncbi:hypothetical protein CJU89_2371 [Yarrowia sp. B02]|nr:hypothetical protein CJU89_2371 [Yarrowia sp. B02]